MAINVLDIIKNLDPLLESTKKIPNPHKHLDELKSLAKIVREHYSKSSDDVLNEAKQNLTKIYTAIINLCDGVKIQCEREKKPLEFEFKTANSTYRNQLDHLNNGQI